MMKNTIVILAIAVSLVCTAQVAVAVDITWVGYWGADWNDANMWDLARRPSSDDRVFVYGHPIILDLPGRPAAQVGELVLPSSKSIRICDNQKLIIHEDSTIGGSIKFVSCPDSAPEGGCIEATGEIAAAETITLTGTDGALIEGHYCTDLWTRGRIITGATKTLTIAGTLKVEGYIDVQAVLVNNATVGPTWPSDVLTLSVGDNHKSGSGLWACQKGTLKVDTEVTGSATWHLYDGADAKIEINTECAPLTGRVNIELGTFEVNESFCTGGWLDFSGGTIDVASGTTAAFAGSCPNT